MATQPAEIAKLFSGRVLSFQHDQRSRRPNWRDLAPNLRRRRFLRPDWGRARRRGARLHELMLGSTASRSLNPTAPYTLAASRDTRLDGDLGGSAPDIASVKICETRGKWDAPQSSHSPCCAWLARPARSAHTHAACHIPSHQWPRARRTAPGAATAAAIPTAEFIGAPWRDYAFSPLHPNTQRANQPLSGD